MELKEVLLQRRRDFNNALCLIGVIPFLVFVYLLVVKIASFGIFVGEIGYIMFATMAIFLLGIAVGKKMFMNLVKELIEKNRLAAITETTLALRHEINNPLLTIRGNLELLESDFTENRVPDNIRYRVALIKNHCERIRQVTDKLSNLSKSISETIDGRTKMIDLTQSE